MKLILREWYGYHWHRAQRDLTDIREAVRAQEARVREARAGYEAVQAEYTAFPRAALGSAHAVERLASSVAELHNQREAISRELAVLEERRRALTNSQAAILSDQEHALNELHLANDRFHESEQDILRVQNELEEAKTQLATCKIPCKRVRLSVPRWKRNRLKFAVRWKVLSQQRAENKARLDELKSRIEAQTQRIEQTKAAIANGEILSARVAAQYEIHTQGARASQPCLQEAEEKVIQKKSEFERIEHERREALEQRNKRGIDHSRLKAQLEVLEQAEQSLAGYAEGARYLLDAARQSKLGGVRGALSAALDVPAELEIAIAAALGDTLDAVLLESNQLEDALNLLETDDTGRAVLLPLDDKASEILKTSEASDGDYLGVASELVTRLGELRGAVRLMLGQTLIVRGRSSARRLIQSLPPHARVVTLRGEVFRGDGLVVAGKTASSSTLGRLRKKREFESTLAGC